MIKLKRAYEAPAPDDGTRVLVDRVWPRGVSKEQIRIDRRMSEIAPSNELRRWFGHDPARWEEFRRRYRAELSDPARQADLDTLVQLAQAGTLTLVYGARDVEHNQAVVLKALLDTHMSA